MVGLGRPARDIPAGPAEPSFAININLTGAVAAAGNHPQQQVTSARALATLRPTRRTVSHVLALGAMAELTRQGATIPNEVAVTGIDDIPIARDLDPGLTTMALPFDQVGRAALRLALDPGAISGDNLIIHGRLVQRASTAR